MRKSRKLLLKAILGNVQAARQMQWGGKKFLIRQVLGKPKLVIFSLIITWIWQIYSLIVPSYDCQLRHEHRRLGFYRRSERKTGHDSSNVAFRISLRCR